jgi:hypothetical protein
MQKQASVEKAGACFGVGYGYHRQMYSNYAQNISAKFYMEQV